jgi:hypothetical protein
MVRPHWSRGCRFSIRLVVCTGAFPVIAVPSNNAMQLRSARSGPFAFRSWVVVEGRPCG